MKYFCHSCETVFYFGIDLAEPFDHALGVDEIHLKVCLYCNSDNLEEIRDHGYLVKTVKDTKIIYDDEDLIDYIHYYGKCEIEEF